MNCCCSAPNLRPPLHHHHHHHRRRVLPRQAKDAIPQLHPITNIPSLASAAAAATGSRRAVELSSPTTSRLVTFKAAAPELKEQASPSSSATSDGYKYESTSSRRVALAAATLGIAAAAFLAGAVDGRQEALALGPDQGPQLAEEFWDNVRRYGLYILTVSTGAIYTILQPIVELLKNPVSAILLLVILGGSFYLLSQVLSFMVGISEFSYDYAS